jgi:hypothetical protein
MTLAEEHAWRHARGVAGWHPEATWPSRALGTRDALRPPRVLEASEVAELYRGLRRGREGAGDAPGAADFYYGEMEMRRAALKTRPGLGAAAERALLTLYWGLAGYGLRASRALAALAILLVVGTGALLAVGLHTPAATVEPAYIWASGDVRYTIHPGERPSGTDALLEVGKAMVPGLRVDDQVLTSAGEAIIIALRLLGPLLLALLLFSWRSQVKR